MGRRGRLWDWFLGRPPKAKPQPPSPEELEADLAKEQERLKAEEDRRQRQLAEARRKHLREKARKTPLPFGPDFVSDDRVRLRREEADLPAGTEGIVAGPFIREGNLYLVQVASEKWIPAASLERVEGGQPPEPS